MSCRNMPNSSNTSRRQNVEACGHDPAGAGSLEQSDNLLESAREIVVVAVDEGDDVARRTSQALVDGLGLAPVGLAHPPGEIILVTPNDLDGPIRGSPVHHEVFQLLVALVEHGRACPLYEPPLVEGRRDDR